MENFWIALLLTLFAGLATGIGSAMAFFAKLNNYRFLAISTAFSSGVMLYVSFVEILVKSVDSMVEVYGDPMGHWIAMASFFGGMLFIGLIDNLIPSAENPHEAYSLEERAPLMEPDSKPHDLSKITGPEREHKGDKVKLMRMGIFTAIAIGIHNFPEGLATFLAALQDPALGVPIAIAIALHNIPEGISVSVPVYYATGSRRKAFTLSFLSGLSEPLGALIAFLAIRLFLGSDAEVIPPQIMGIMFGGVAGIMVYISLDELLPTSRAYGKGHDSIIGVTLGMAVMAISLVLMR